MTSTSRNITMSAAAVLLLALTAPLHAQQPAAVDTACVQAADTMKAGNQGKAVCKNQTQSGVTDSSGTSTLGVGVGKSTEANAPVTAKGDTLKKPKDAGSK